MALIQGEMVSLDGKITYATVEHHKVRVPTPKQHLGPEFEVEWDRVMREEEQKTAAEKQKKVGERAKI